MTKRLLYEDDLSCIICGKEESSIVCCKAMPACTDCVDKLAIRFNPCRFCGTSLPMPKLNVSLSNYVCLAKAAVRIFRLHAKDNGGIFSMDAADFDTILLTLEYADLMDDISCAFVDYGGVYDEKSARSTCIEIISAPSHADAEKGAFMNEFKNGLAILKKHKNVNVDIRCRDGAVKVFVFV